MPDIDFLTARPIAHRGLHDGNRVRYENSLAAAQAAVDANFSIEVDLQLSADGEAIVFHDKTLERLTSETGPVAARDSAELFALKLGDTQERIPSLPDLLDLVDGRVALVLEMKSNPGHSPELAQATARALEGYDGPVAVMSFAHSLLAAWRQTGAPAPLGLTAEGIGTKALEGHEEAFAYDIAFLSYHVKALPNPFVAHVRESRRLPVISWTVRTEEDIAATRTHADQMTFEGFDPDL
ncbi:glycerophosphodiester phosphodiesterase family protein [Oricola sp.]|uniref:glycerophosphodiester phosphodiesterase family protein n=1 Tax=Oricola sp. TaxID=1979950 RepID=UPI003BABD31D